MEKSLRNERGIALVIALLLLLVLTIIGGSAVSTTIYENKISGIERIATEAFYAAEAGVERGLDQIPGVTPINPTKLGEEAYYWSGAPADKQAPKNIQSLGSYTKPGFDASWAFKRFQVNATGESGGSTKQIELQVCYGPYANNTQYHNN